MSIYVCLYIHSFCLFSSLLFSFPKKKILKRPCIYTYIYSYDMLICSLCSKSGMDVLGSIEAWLLTTVVIILSLLCYRMASRWMSIEAVKTRREEGEYQRLQAEHEDLKEKHRRLGTRYNRTYSRLSSMRDGYDLSEDEDYDDEEPDEDIRLSDLARSVGIQLPKTIAKHVDQPQFQSFLVEQFKKNPNLLTDVISKIKKPDAKPAPSQPSFEAQGFI